MAVLLNQRVALPNGLADEYLFDADLFNTLLNMDSTIWKFIRYF